MITYKLNIHCQEPRYYASDMEFVTGDVGAYCLEFTFFDNGKKMDLENYALTVKGRRADGVVLSDAGEIKDGVGRIVLKNGFYDVPGTVELEIALTDSAKNHVTTKIVSATVIAGAGVPEGTVENDVNVYVTLIAQLKAMMDKLPAYDNAVASGEYAHAEGQDTVASALTAHAEGRDTQAVEKYSHAEGRRTTASGIASHVEGINSVASGQGSHAEGLNSVASGQYSHAEGDNTQATGQYGAHSEGAYTQAGGETSHAEGYHTIASGNYQHVQGRFNVEDTRGIYAHIVGGGNDSASPKNIHTIDWSGNAMFSGKVSALGGILATEKYVEEKIDTVDTKAEKVENKVEIIDIDFPSSSHSLYPSAKAVCDALAGVNSNLSHRIYNNEDLIMEDSRRITKIEEDLRTVADGEMSDTSEKAVQNKVIKKYVDNSAENMKTVFANALKGNASGEVIRADDVSPVEHTMKVKVSSKNVLPYPYTNKTLTTKGITFTDNGDGTLTVNGTADGQAVFRLLYDTTKQPQPFKGGVTYYKNSPHTQIAYMDEEGTLKYLGKSTTTFTWDDRWVLSNISINIADGTTIDNETWYPQIKIGTSPTSYTPYVGDLTSVTVKTVGKNLLPYPYTSTTKKSYGITFTDNGDGTITVNGTSTDYASFYLTNTFNFVGGVTYCISTGDAQCGIVSYKDENGVTRYVTEKLKNTFTWDERWTLINIYLQISPDTTVNTTAYPMIEIGNTQTEYKPYKIPTEYMPNADGTVDDVKSIYPNMTLMTDTEGVVIDCEYNKDINKVIEGLVSAIISLGGNV